MYYIFDGHSASNYSSYLALILDHDGVLIFKIACTYTLLYITDAMIAFI